MKPYTSKVYVGKNYDAVVTSYYGSSSFPSDFYEVLYRVHKEDTSDPYWSNSTNWVYTSKSAALKRAREISNS